MNVALITMLFVSLGAFAHPVPYHGAIGAMTSNQPFMSDSMINYGFRPDMAVAARFMRMQMPEGDFRYSGAQLNYLVLRKNELHSQANVYAYVGGGATHFEDAAGGATFFGVEADAETRKYFASIKSEQMNASIGPDFSHIEARLGVAPYEAEYTELASWLMVQAQWHPSLSRKFVFTPLARFFYKSALWETGVSTDGEWMLNIMFHL